MNKVLNIAKVNAGVCINGGGEFVNISLDISERNDNESREAVQRSANGRQ